jgi:fructosamine-3-kinase
MSPLQPILDDCGITVHQCERVHGGDINNAFCLHGKHEKYFLKTNDAAEFPGMFEQEAIGLNALRNNSSLHVPVVIKYGVVSSQQYLLLEWIEPGKRQNNFWETFGAGLATMHLKQQSYFGWEQDNYIGSLPQRNVTQNSWSSFYVECRIMPLVKLLVDSGAFNKNDQVAADKFYAKAEKIFPAEPPSLLHGDLWSGNFMIAQNGTAAIFDPAVYCGHREMDIGMSKLFGGFDNRFYDAYNEVYPLEKNWQQRLSYTQLYPLLVHAILFGGHYVQSARSILNKFN